MCRVPVTALATMSEFCSVPGPGRSALHKCLSQSPQREAPSLAHVTGVKTEAQTGAVTCQHDTHMWPGWSEVAAVEAAFGLFI